MKNSLTLGFLRTFKFFSKLSKMSKNSGGFTIWHWGSNDNGYVVERFNYMGRDRSSRLQVASRSVLRPSWLNCYAAKITTVISLKICQAKLNSISAKNTQDNRRTKCYFISSMLQYQNTSERRKASGCWRFGSPVVYCIPELADPLVHCWYSRGSRHCL